jgi:hypothetical protein
MLDIETGVGRTCDGITRREVMRIGALSAFGLTLPGLLQARAEGKTPTPKREPACILLWLNGGPSQIDTFDPKPNAPQEIRGQMGAIATNVAGIQISDQLPLLAKQMDKFSIVRSVTSPDGNHETATHYLLTGYPFNPAVEYPAYGSVMAREGGYQNGMPPYILMHGLPFNHGYGGYMGATYNPFMIGGDTNDPNFSVRDVTAPNGVDFVRMERRQKLRDALDNWQRGKESSKAAQTMDEFTQRAYALITSPAAKKAFSLKEEPEKLREEYGRNNFGQSCLLARRLVEAGVRCVTINMEGWDTHTDNFNAMKGHLLPRLDKGYAALLRDLKDRGMLETTLVVCMGEFGRTPVINGAAGRDHWSQVFSVTMGGGGVKMGTAVGTSNERAEVPKDRPVRVEDIAATLYKAMGIDGEKEYMSPQERPLKINYDGTPLPELI